MPHEQRARKALEAAGGLCSQAGMAERFGVSAQRVSQMVRHRSFPEPIPVDDGKRRVWFIGEVEAWRAR